MAKPSVEAKAVFGKGEETPRPVRPFIMAGSMAVEAVRGLGSSESQNRAVVEKLAASTEARRRTTKFARFLRLEFGGHLANQPLMFKSTGLPYEMSLEAETKDDKAIQETAMVLDVTSQAGRHSRFYIKSEEVAGNEHPTLASWVTIGSVTPPAERRQLYEGGHYSPRDEAAMCRTVMTAMDDFEKAYDAGELEIYQLATDRSRPTLYS